MAKVDKLTKSNLVSFLNGRTPKAKLGDSTNPLKSWLAQYGIKSTQEVLSNPRTPVWLRELVEQLAAQNVNIFSVARVQKILNLT